MTIQSGQPRRSTGKRFPEPSTVSSRLLATVLLACAGCALFHHRPESPEAFGLIAVMPIDRNEPARTPGEPSRLAPGAERVVTAQIYRVLSSSSEWRFVPDLTAGEALRKIETAGDQATRARALGKAVHADAVLFGTVSRYVERVGAEYGAREPAAVGFTLHLISVSSGRILWEDTFDQQQQALSTNLFNWWQFWRGGPRWFTAEQFTGLGVERLLEGMPQ